MSAIAVSEKIVAVCQSNLVDCYDSKEHYILQCDSGPNDLLSDIVISSDNKYLAYITSVTKKLLIYDLSDFKCMKTITLPRSASKIRFAVNNAQIFVADKTGDVLLYDILSDESGTKILGHLSLLLNVLQTNDGKYVITSDRDEKIKVSQFPNTYNIQTFCLGHTEFVNHIELLPHDEKCLISASGDGTVKCWDYLTGRLLYSFDTNSKIDDIQIKEEFKKVMDTEGVEVNSLPIVNFAVTNYNETCSLIAVAVYSYKKLILYSLSSSDSKFSHKLEKEISFEICPTSFKFCGSFLIIYDDANLKLLKYNITSQAKEINLTLINEINVFEDKNIKAIPDSDLNSIKVMFKRKFDNVQEYQERKKQRLAKPS